MAKPCKKCKGRGTWQEQEEGPSGLTTVTQKVCNDCRGTGKVIDLEDDEEGDYDIGGDSFMEDDE